MKLPLRVAVFGPESTGKTALAARLAAHFGEPWAPEHVREYWDRAGGRIGPADLDAIARGQLALEEAAAARARRVVFCDTELLTCTLWNDLLFPGACPPWLRAEAERRARGYALYLHCVDDLPYAPDPQRCFPGAEERSRAAARWREALVSRALPRVDIKGAGPDRERRAVAAVERLLAELAAR
ncbi:MAG: AAA family ATPase [Verrucomicrobiota bacterium]